MGQPFWDWTEHLLLPKGGSLFLTAWNGESQSHREYVHNGIGLLIKWISDYPNWKNKDRFSQSYRKNTLFNTKYFLVAESVQNMKGHRDEPHENSRKVRNVLHDLENQALHSSISHSHVCLQLFLWPSFVRDKSVLTRISSSVLSSACKILHDIKMLDMCKYH